MKLKRSKAYRKTMQYMQLNFKFREPYQVIVDEEIILECVRINYDLKAGLERTLQGEVKILVTQCTIEHLYRSKNNGAIDLAKTFERRRCGHIPKDEQTLSAYECISAVVNVKGTNKHRYCVATQKPKLREQFRNIPAVPLIYIARSVMVMEPLSPVTLEARKGIEAAKLTVGLPSGEEPQKRKRGPKEPNPLSVKKKQKIVDQGPGLSHKRRKRGKRGQDEHDNAPTSPGSSAQGTTEPTHSESQSNLTA